MNSDGKSPILNPSPTVSATNGEPATETAVDGDLIQLIKPTSSGKNKPNLAQRIASRTTDLIAVSIVIVFSLTLGRQLVIWWQTDPPPVLDLSVMGGQAADWGADDKPVQLHFANSPVGLIRQQVSQGGIDAALDVIRSNCQDHLRNVDFLRTTPDEGELEMLSTIGKLSPEIEQPGVWQIFHLDSGLPLLVGVRYSQVESNAESEPAKQFLRRVTCWGVAFPGGNRGTWTTFTFVKGARSSNDSTRTTSHSIPDGLQLNDIQLPVGCRKTVCLQEPAQGGLLGFEASSTDQNWTRHFNEEFARRGWSQTQEWQVQGNGVTARFSLEKSLPIVDLIQIQWTRSGEKTIGLIQWLRSAVNSPTGSNDR